jgi:hypothetical protein
MEQYINDNLSDITYQSELIPADSFCIRKSESKRRGLIRAYNLRSLTFRKLCAH